MTFAKPVAWRYRHPLNPNLWVVVAGPDWPERDPDMEPLIPAVALDDLLAALTVATDTLKAFDPGDQSTETGWAHDELCDAWMQCQAAIAKATA